MIRRLIARVLGASAPGRAHRQLLSGVAGYAMPR